MNFIVFYLQLVSKIVWLEEIIGIVIEWHHDALQAFGQVLGHLNFGLLIQPLAFLLSAPPFALESGLVDIANHSPEKPACCYGNAFNHEATVENLSDIVTEGNAQHFREGSASQSLDGSDRAVDNQVEDWSAE